MTESKHLLEVITRHNRIAIGQIVFLDIEKYSKRRTQAQIATIDLFTSCLGKALSHVGKEYLDYAQTNDVNFSTDIIKLPTGDGAAIGFTFDGLHDIHLQFALQFLRESHIARAGAPCDKFDLEGWCNCHPYFNARIGIDEGKVIVYKDVNGQYNLAGGVVNLAARVMGQVEPNQVAFAANAYETIVDMIDDPMMSDRFVAYPNVKLKHGTQIVIYQYIDPQAEGLNSDPIEALEFRAHIEDTFERFQKRGLVPAGLTDPTDVKKFLTALKAVEAAWANLGVPATQETADTDIE